MGEIVYGVEEGHSKIEQATVIKATTKQVFLDGYIHYVDLNGTVRFSKTIHRRFISATGLPKSPEEAVQQIYRTMIFERMEALARYSEMLRGISARQEKMDALVKSLKMSEFTKYPLIRRSRVRDVSRTTSEDMRSLLKDDRKP